ncbi:hypothetical protein LE181_29095 [Streptomyces sp. SCA3-4]|uniref:hypothetical protein n=1 Tax=Streptomyces sichuanensis TaxID=2871810 RepID=UPI001CE33FA2|nr:hypothetical protein [Streptomyces sichuanensis]MCA6096208.1 hypothetical protein [Streptomyces sichuanensis]
MSRAEAPKVLQRFTDGYTEAYRKLDPALVDRVETGALAEMGRADMVAQRALTPGGNPGYPALVLKDARFTIPKSAGWPKFFVADTRSNRDDNRWLVVFTRSGARQPWKAAYLSLLAEGKVPKFVLDEDGYAEAVPARTTDGKGGKGGGNGKDSGAGKNGGNDKAGDGGKGAASGGLMADPGVLSSSYTDYLRTGEGRTFAPGGATSQLRTERGKLARTPTFWTEYIDTPEQAPDFPALALRTEGGGALAFFTAHHRERRTMVKGVRPEVTDPRTKALLKGDLKQAVTYTRISEAAVRVPARDADGGRVVFLNRIESLTAAKGE